MLNNQRTDPFKPILTCIGTHDWNEQKMDNLGITLHQLYCFLTLSQTLHYTETSKLLFISQPSVSYAISRLEDYLGIKLFVKHGQTISMTRSAEIFLPYASSAINSIEVGLSRIKKELDSGIIRLGYIYSISFDFLPNLLSILNEDNLIKKFQFSFYQGQYEDLIDKLNKDELDIAFCPIEEDLNISCMPLYEQEIYLIVSNNHAFANRETVSFNEIVNEKFAVLSQKSNLQKLLNNIFIENEFSANVVFEAEECSSVASFVASGSGVAFLPKIPSMKLFKLSLIRISGVPIFRTINLLWREESDFSFIIKSIQSNLDRVGFD